MYAGSCYEVRVKLQRSDVYGSDLHLADLERVVIAGPRLPLDAVSERRVCSGQVAPIEVGQMTRLVPPAALVHLRARARPHVVVLVVRAELLTDVRRQRVTWPTTPSTHL